MYHKFSFLFSKITFNVIQTFIINIQKYFIHFFLFNFNLKTIIITTTVTKIQNEEKKVIIN